jgi:hypothetical protein
MTTRDARAVIHQHIGFDAYRPTPTHILWRRVAILVVAILAILAAAKAMAEETSTLVLRACAEGQCKTVRISVDACTAGGQAALAEWLAQHPTGKVVTFKCFDGQPA